MKFLAALRRYCPVLINLCLIAALCFSGGPAVAQTMLPVQIARSAPTDQPPVTPTDTSLSVTQGVRKTVLDNGLTVLTKEIHTAPVVSVQVWYRVGSRNEGPGLSGISHQLEHLLFKGTTSRPIQFGRLFSALGSASNAFTSYDQTAYFGTVSKDKLQALLVLEADRMQNALVNAEQLASEKRVVISELQGYENNPGYRLRRAVMQAAFPDREYGLPVGGTKADVERFTIQQVRDYYQTYYSPDNAVLVITGDFSTEPVLNSVREIFGKVPKLAKTAPAGTATASAKSSKAPVILKQPGSAKLLQAVYPLPDVNHPDVPAIDVMDAILTQGRSSRFYQALVETGLVSGISAYPAELIEPGWYSISATAAPNQELTKIDQVLQRSIADVQQGVTSEELNRAKTQLRASFILNNRDINNQASQLAYDQSVAGDYRYSDRYLAALAKVNAADVKRVARTYLNPAKRTVGFFEPTAPANGQPSTAAGETQQTTENFSPGEPVDPAEVAKYLPPMTAEVAATQQPLPEQLTLSNGLQVLLLPDRSTPTVSLSGQIQAGSDFDSNAKAGVAALTAESLKSGTRTKNALAIAKALEDRGASLAFGSNREGVTIGGNALIADLPVLVQTLADVIQNPNFPKKELELSRQRALTALKVALDDPQQLGRRVFQQAIYPQNHPFYSFPTEASLKQITRADLVRFHQTHYRPDTTVLTLVGDFDPAQVRSLLNRALGQWQAKGKSPTLKFPSVTLPKSVVRLNPVLPGKSQSVTYLGYQGIARKDPRYYAAMVLNQVLGGDTLSSRLGTEIRDRQGLTYGIYSYFQAGLYPGPFLIQMQTAPEDTQRAIASTLTLLKQFRDQGITTAELESAQRSIVSSYPVELASPDALADVFLANEVYGLGAEEIRQFPLQIQAVTANQVQQAAQALIHPNNLVVVTAGAAVEPVRSVQRK